MNKLEKIINDSGIKFENDDAKKTFMKQIDEDYVNGIVDKNNTEYANEKKNLDERYSKLNEEFEASKKTMKELQTQVNKTTAENQILKDKSLATKVAGEMDDEQFEELMLLTNAKLSKNKDLKKEDVMKDIAEKRNFGKKVKENSNPMGNPIPASKNFNGTYMPEENDTETLDTQEQQFEHFMKHGGH